MTSMVPRSQAIQDEGARHTVSAPSFGEEIASSITHGIGLIASLSALPFLVVAGGPLVSHVAAAGVRWLVVGGVCYTAGVAFFAWQRLRYGHALWHLCVAAGSACHFVAVLRFAVGPVA